MFAPHAILRICSILTLCVFLTVVGFGISSGMMIDKNGIASPCHAMDDMGTFCPMTLAAHLAGWQELSSATAQESAFGIISLALFFSILSFVLPKRGMQIFFAQLRNRNRRHSIFHPLFDAFSRGIIHSRLFAV